MGDLPDDKDFKDSEYRKHFLQNGDSEYEDIQLEDMTILELINFDNAKEYIDGEIVHYKYNVRVLKDIVQTFQESFEEYDITKSNVIRTMIRWVYYKNKETIDSIKYITEMFVEGRDGFGRSTCRVDSQLYSVLSDISSKSYVSIEVVVSFYISLFCDYITDNKTKEDIVSEFALMLKHSNTLLEEHKESKIAKTIYTKINNNVE